MYTEYVEFYDFARFMVLIGGSPNGEKVASGGKDC